MQKQYREFLDALEAGEIRAAEKSSDGSWYVNQYVQHTIHQLFCTLENIEMWSESDLQYFGFIDRELLRPRSFRIDHDKRLRIAPGGTSVRPGSYLGERVVVLPPSHINIGAYIDHGTMIDSHVLVGSCAQLGKNVHVSAGVTIGGVLEPIGAMPTIIEDNAFIGAGAVLTEGILIKQGAVIAPGVALSAGVKIYDGVKNEIYQGVIPENAVVISGARPAGNTWLNDLDVHLYCAVIIKYRDHNTDAALILTEGFR